jgi:hypothetical protein
VLIFLDKSEMIGIGKKMARFLSPNEHAHVYGDSSENKPLVTTIYIGRLFCYVISFTIVFVIELLHVFLNREL